MPSLDSFFKAVIEGAKTLAVGELKNFGKQIQVDAKSLLENSRTDLQTWTKGLAEGKLDQTGFDFLMRQKADLALMEAITQAGIGQARVKQLRDALINLVIDKAFATFLP